MTFCTEHLAEGIDMIGGDCLAVLPTLAENSIDSCVTDPPYGLEFMGKEWDKFAPRERKNASVWDGRRQAQSGWREDASARSGKGGGGPSYRSQHKGSKRCALCGKRAFSGSPCECPEPQWVIEHRQEAPTAMLGFQAFMTEWAHEVYRVIKPGAHLLAFGGTRTYHRLACAIEDAGFEIRDSIADLIASDTFVRGFLASLNDEQRGAFARCVDESSFSGLLHWVFGQGFPKNLDVSRAIDRAAPRVGMFEPFALHYEERRKANGFTHAAVCAAGKFFDNVNHGGASVNWGKGHNVPTLEQWRVLRPLLGLSLEFLPLIERVEAERQKIGERASGDPVAWYAEIERGDGIVDITEPATDAARQWLGFGTALKPACEPIVLARKPLSESTVAANVLRWGTGALNIDGARVEGSPSGLHPYTRNVEQRESQAANHREVTFTDHPSGRWPANVILSDDPEVQGAFPQSDIGGAGSAARFFYCAKGDADDRLGSRHPTVKPVDLIQYLVRLVTPPKGLVLDCFAGTGTTGEACIREGFRAILIEREEEYQEDIRRRMKLAMCGPSERAFESQKARNKDKPVDHGPLFGGNSDTPPAAKADRFTDTSPTRTNDRSDRTQVVTE